MARTSRTPCCTIVLAVPPAAAPWQSDALGPFASFRVTIRSLSGKSGHSLGERPLLLTGGDKLPADWDHLQTGSTDKTA